MTYDTLVTAKGPTLRDGLAEILRQADIIHAANELGCGVRVFRTDSDHLLAVETDPELPAGVIAHERYTPLLEHLAYWPNRDVVVTADGLVWL